MTVRRVAVLRCARAPDLRGWPVAAAGTVSGGWDDVRRVFGVSGGTRPGLAHRVTATGRPVVADAAWADPASAPVWGGGEEDGEDAPWAGLYAGLVFATRAAARLEPPASDEEAYMWLWPDGQAERFALCRAGAAHASGDRRASPEALAGAVAGLFGIAHAAPPPAWLDAVWTAAERGPAAAWRRR